MDDRAFEVGATAAVLLVFVVVMAVAESIGGGRWGVLVAVAVFVLGGSAVGYVIAQRTYT